MISILPRNFRIARASRLLSTSLNNFGGGWNTVDDDISMDPRFCVTLTNLRRTVSGAQEVRWGSRWRADVASAVDGDIVDITYFNSRLIAVTTAGQIAAIDDDYNVTAIWNSDLAAALAGGPTGWAAGITTVNFVPYKSDLIIHNGQDKPVTISSIYDTTYLQDLATGSNVNVPIGKYGCVVGNYHVVAGIPSDPTVLYVASVGTAGVFPGDPDPNDAISIDVGAYVPEGGSAIRGIAGFRNNLIVFFRHQALIITLGEYDSDGNHVPQFPDTLPHFGLLGHRCIATVGNDLHFADIDGLNSAKRNLFSGLVDSEHLSDVIAPSYRAAFRDYTLDEILVDSFVVRNRLDNETMVFSPSGEVYVYSDNEKLKYKAWSLNEGWTFTAGCSSFYGRVYLTKGSRIYQLGNKVFNEQFNADFLADRDGEWAISTAYAVGDLIYDSVTEEVYECSVSHTSSGTGTFALARATNPTYWTLYEGEDITFTLETPWLTGREAMKTKLLRYLSVASKGYAQFTVKAYVDNLYKDQYDAVVHDPALTLEFVGNDAGGYGYDSEGYGGGRRSGDPRLWRYPVKFKMIKFVLSGATKNPLQLISLSFLYSQGAYKR